MDLVYWCEIRFSPKMKISNLKETPLQRIQLVPVPLAQMAQVKIEVFSRLPVG